ncbi:MAG: hypothetical protein NTY17_05020 [Planctomycetia bacterium]|nr:hypothetical protein [Planctomycetia bacterium]
MVRPIAPKRAETASRPSGEIRSTIGPAKNRNDRAGDLGDPRVGAEFHVADHGVHQQQRRQQQVAEPEAGGGAEGDEQTGRDGPGHERRQAEVALEEEGEQTADHCGTDQPKLTEHVLEAHAGTARLALGEPLAEHHQAVEHDGG